MLIKGDKIVIQKIDAEELTAHLVGGELPTLQELEQGYIEKVLIHVNHNRTKAAAILGIDRVSLWRKIRKYNSARASSAQAGDRAGRKKAGSRLNADVIGN